MVKLSKELPFARGGVRACYIDPRDPDRVIKVLQPGMHPGERRARASLRKRLKPLSSFDDNATELENVRWIERKWGRVPLIPADFREEETDLGTGVSSQLFRDHDGRISRPLEIYLWQEGLSPAIKAAIENFKREWQDLAIPTRSILLHNLVLVNSEKSSTIKFVDDFGFPDFLKLAKWSPHLRRSKVRRRLALFQGKLETLIAIRDGGNPTLYGRFDKMIDSIEAFERLERERGL